MVISAAIPSITPVSGKEGPDVAPWLVLSVNRHRVGWMYLRRNAVRRIDADKPSHYGAVTINQLRLTDLRVDRLMELGPEGGLEGVDGLLRQELDSQTAIVKDGLARSIWAAEKPGIVVMIEGRGRVRHPLYDALVCGSSPIDVAMVDTRWAPTAESTPAVKEAIPEWIERYEVLCRARRIAERDRIPGKAILTAGQRVGKLKR
jgi:hypothetical protein